MKVVASWMMEGQRPATPEWNGEGRHPILGLTMEEIKLMAFQSRDRYTPRADNPEKSPVLSTEQEVEVMKIKAVEMAQAHSERLSIELEAQRKQS